METANCLRRETRIALENNYRILLLLSATWCVLYYLTQWTCFIHSNSSYHEDEDVQIQQNCRQVNPCDDYWLMQNIIWILSSCGFLIVICGTVLAMLLKHLTQSLTELSLDVTLTFPPLASMTSSIDAGKAWLHIWWICWHLFYLCLTNTLSERFTTVIAHCSLMPSND